MKTKYTSSQFVVCLCAMLKRINNIYKGEEMDALISSEFSHCRGYEEYRQELLVVLIQHGMPCDIEAFMQECAKLLGWRLILRRFYNVAEFTTCGSNARHEADFREFAATDSLIRTFRPNDHRVHFSPLGAKC